MSKCAYCNNTFSDIIICPKCNNNICYKCLELSMTHNDGNFLCLFCNYDLSKFMEEYLINTSLYKDIIVYDDEPIHEECILCYDTFNIDHIIKCNTCNKSYCIECFKQLINSNNSHICANCRQVIPKSLINKGMRMPLKPKFQYSCHIRTCDHPYDINDKLIKCSYCEEQFEYDTLIKYFISKYKYNKNYIPECLHCHKIWDNVFMYDNFEIEFCKNIMNIEDPYCCKGCQTRNPPKYTCKYCNTEICRICMKQYFESIQNHKNLDCMNCYHLYNEYDLYDNIFKNEIDYVKNILQVENPYECKLCKKDFTVKIRNGHSIISLAIRCESCRKYFCFNCFFDYLEKLAVEYKNTHTCKYIEEGYYKCPYCNNSFSNKFLYYSYNCHYNHYLLSLGKDYEENPCHDRLYLIDTVHSCCKCEKSKYDIFMCKHCYKMNCLDCLCENLKQCIKRNPDIPSYNVIRCICCKKILFKSTELYKYLDEQTCKDLLISDDDFLIYNKQCPFCNKIIYHTARESIEAECDYCGAIFNFYNTSKIIHEPRLNKYYLEWVNKLSLKY